MASNELARFFDSKLDKQEGVENGNDSHSELLEKAFTALTQELNTKGNTAKFQELRREHGQKLLAFWRDRKQRFEQAASEGLLKEGLSGAEHVEGDERISVARLGVYEDDDGQVLLVTIKSPVEEAELSVAASIFSGIDEIMHLPTIMSEIRTEPSEPADVFYEVTLREGKISTFERSKVHSDPNHMIHHIKDTRTIQF